MTAPRLDAVATADRVAGALIGAGFAPFFGTPCGILAPLYAALPELLTVAREDNAVGVAAGAALAGHVPAVLMQNSGLGQSVNALASLAVPYRIPMLLVVSLRGAEGDPTPENRLMGELTEPLLAGLEVPAEVLAADGDAFEAQAGRLRRVVGDGPAALLVPPAALGWRA
ncbi:thiamine pyrophosphate-binding protein [Amycolatopsis sp. PS_44_ISF1]|uniref:thiamine pyrophosphate-binding protein n=1 Tax=Amycolatopsis sp. PS_44_ISF1 TaxID=2974917 RepID=UPI0028E02528|nr:thiamine pyrophosphate-binding protein [Amycolatopsis sp. PS_44_ISF1]MDT8914699.1 thiamine pyrophosphate-binding protein [Amycolatopsis sp. PS_44_ISF1]